MSSNYVFYNAILFVSCLTMSMSCIVRNKYQEDTENTKAIERVIEAGKEEFIIRLTVSTA